MIRIIKNILYWLVAVGYVILTLSLISLEKAKISCTTVDIDVIDSVRNRFVDHDDVLKKIATEGIRTIGQPLDSVNRAEIEDAIMQIPAVKNAEVYMNLDGVLHIDIRQRTPLVRVVNYNGESYYIDIDGFLMPLSDKYSAHVQVASGNLNYPFATFSKQNVMEVESADELNREFLLDDIYTLAGYFKRNSLWDAQIEQLYVNNSFEFELIPKVGNHIILLGKLDQYEEKLNSLEILYKRAFQKIGWNKYKVINLKYRNQIVCTKR